MGLVVCPEDKRYCSPLSICRNKKFFMALWFISLGSDLSVFCNLLMHTAPENCRDGLFGESASCPD